MELAEIAESVYAKAGVTGLLFLFAGWIVFLLVKKIDMLILRIDDKEVKHSTERNKWQDSFIELTNKTNDSINRNSLVITELTTIIKDRK